MRFLIIPRPSKQDETPRENAPFDEKVFMAHMKYNEDMHRAGVLLAAEGLSASDRGAHVVFAGGKGTVLDGPFAETKELIGGFYMIEVASKEEAIAWALRYPGGFGNDDVLEIRPLTGASDLPPEIHELIEKAAPTWSVSFARPRSQ
ncbi:YciI family protein [Chondromyces crocatus]|uniref:YCII-related domain-containing protein n=1 Tax=Chondromyces crocatus TaxID=52 RepID=A0A0K1EI37_CHOCO|nr:YciI family protein [Chondromyces crocatus]AKT40531.1 uncharacterized protein CMC5_046860 [Chondromyces crocatus]